MGTYLSTPVLDKGQESGETLKCPVSPLAWGVVDMQGWRKSMEDAHVACTDVQIPLHLDEQDDLKSEGKVFGVFDGHGGPEVARFCQLYLVDVLTCMTTWKEDSPTVRDAVGQALVAAFHALDRMVDDPLRRDELIRLRSEKPEPGERRKVVLDLPDGFCEEPIPRTHEVTVTEDCVSPTHDEESSSDDAEEFLPDPRTDEGREQEATREAVAVEPVVADEKEDAKDDDSNEAVGHEHAANQHEFEMEHEIDERDPDHEKPNPAVVTPEPAFLEHVVDIGGGEQLSISRNDSGQVEIQVTDEEDVEESDVVLVESSEESKSNGPSVSLPTLVQNGRQVCNLPDHPIHAGCTAVVGVLIGRTLTIANAGDSRAVLCREGGRAEPLSFDHKPLQESEMQRITKAGGFVNQFGRVNGNLNLSRSIGDLKYKQVPGLPPAEQMITAQPDIIQVTLQPKDEFFVLGCDGIWDCLTNEQAIQYVRERIDSKTPTEIGAEMLDDIISDDPRATQGIGGDNMTIMIVDLQPEIRAYR